MVNTARLVWRKTSFLMIMVWFPKSIYWPAF